MHSLASTSFVRVQHTAPMWAPALLCDIHKPPDRRILLQYLPAATADFSAWMLLIFKLKKNEFLNTSILLMRQLFRYSSSNSVRLPLQPSSCRAIRTHCLEVAQQLPHSLSHTAVYNLNPRLWLLRAHCSQPHHVAMWHTAKYHSIRQHSAHKHSPGSRQQQHPLLSAQEEKGMLWAANFHIALSHFKDPASPL